MAWSSSSSSKLYPNIADSSHATKNLTETIEGYFTVKSQHNASAWIDYFNPAQSGYYDGTLGSALPSYQEIKSAFANLTKSWPPSAKSYPLIILGDLNSAVLYTVDTPELFGGEIRALTSVVFTDGKVSRLVDHWDGRQNPAKAASVPDSEYPIGLGLNMTKTTPAGSCMESTVKALSTALAAGNANESASLFNYDAVFEDLTLRTRQDGQLAITSYLQRTIDELPYGRNSSLQLVLGSDVGGGYEWGVGDNPTLNGITALKLDHDGKISLMISAWDGTRVSNSTLSQLVSQSIP